MNGLVEGPLLVGGVGPWPPAVLMCTLSFPITSIRLLFVASTRCLADLK